MADIVLNVEVRDRAGTGAARAARAKGQVPGVLYGGDKEPVAIAVQAKEFRKALHTGKLLGHLVTLRYGEEEPAGDRQGRAVPPGQRRPDPLRPLPRRRPRRGRIAGAGALPSTRKTRPA